MSKIGIGFGFILFALLASQMATATEFSVSSFKEAKNNIVKAPGSQTTFDSKRIQDFKAALSNSRLHSEIQKEKITRGGSDSGGGQGVYDMRTGQLHFVDLYTREELQQMQLSPNPQAEVFSKFPNCTKEKMAHISSEKKSARNDAIKILKSFQARIYLPAKSFDFVFFSKTLTANSTSLRLQQLMDATSVAPQFQIQLAIFYKTNAFFQNQALALLPREEAPYLYIKEMLRFIAFSNLVAFKNIEIEEAVRLIYRQNIQGFLESNYYRKLMRPRFVMEYPDAIEGKEKYAENRLKNPNISSEERAILENDLFAIQCWKGVEWPPSFYNYYQRTSEVKTIDSRCGDPDQYKNGFTREGVPQKYLIFFHDPKSKVSDLNFFFPLPFSKTAPLLAPIFHAYNNETGKIEQDVFGKCSSDKDK